MFLRKKAEKRQRTKCKLFILFEFFFDRNKTKKSCWTPGTGWNMTLRFRFHPLPRPTSQNSGNWIEDFILVYQKNIVFNLVKIRILVLSYCCCFFSLCVTVFLGTEKRTRWVWRINVLCNQGLPVYGKP